MRMNISVPDELAEQVRARELPISGICQDALRKAVELDEKKEKILTDLDSVVERLRGTQDSARLDAVEHGRALGDRWAREWASFDELKDVAKMDPWQFSQNRIDSIREFYVETGRPDRDFRHYDTDMSAGFIEGAREIWEAVEPRL